MEKYGSFETMELMASIEKSTMDLLNIFINNVGFDLIYDINSTYQKLFALYHVKFKEDNKDNYLEYLVNYIKVVHELMDCNIIITFGLSNLLLTSEKELLESELLLHNLIILDFIVGKERIDSINKIIVDNDCCII